MSYRQRWQDRWFTGHISWWRITIYGANAMHWAINVRMFGGYLCFHPRTRTFGCIWPAYLYFSKNATPTNARWMIGKRWLYD